MKIMQISIFLENEAGRLAEVTRILKEGEINLRAITVADTADFGILRIIADDPEKAISVLHAANFTTKTTSVLAVTVKDEVGSLANVLDVFAKNKINIEYLYAALNEKDEKAVIIFKVEDIEKGMAVVKENGLGSEEGF